MGRPLSAEGPRGVGCRDRGGWHLFLFVISFILLHHAGSAYAARYFSGFATSANVP